MGMGMGVVVVVLGRRSEWISFYFVLEFSKEIRELNGNGSSSSGGGVGEKK